MIRMSYPVVIVGNDPGVSVGIKAHNIPFTIGKARDITSFSFALDKPPVHGTVPETVHCIAADLSFDDVLIQIRVPLTDRLMSVRLVIAPLPHGAVVGAAGASDPDAAALPDLPAVTAVIKHVRAIPGIHLVYTDLPVRSVEDHPVRNVYIENLNVQFRGGLTLDDVKEQRGCNPFFIPSARKATDMGEANYPEPSAHGIQPAWGFSISHAEDIYLKNVHLETIYKDERPAFYTKDTKNIHFEEVTCPDECPGIQP